MSVERASTQLCSVCLGGDGVVDRVVLQRLHLSKFSGKNAAELAKLLKQAMHFTQSCYRCIEQCTRERSAGKCDRAQFERNFCRILLALRQNLNSMRLVQRVRARKGYNVSGWDFDEAKKSYEHVARKYAEMCRSGGKK